MLYSNPDINYDLCYATVVDGKFVPTSIVAHDIAERTQAEIEYLSTCTINAASPEVLDLREGNEGPRRVHYASTADGIGKYGTSALGAVKVSAMQDPCDLGQLCRCQTPGKFHY